MGCVSNEFFSLVGRFANNFHLRLRHSWKLLANHPTFNQKHPYSWQPIYYSISSCKQQDDENTCPMPCAHGQVLGLVLWVQVLFHTLINCCWLPGDIRYKGIIRHDLDLDGYLETSVTRALLGMSLTLMVTWWHQEKGHYQAWPWPWLLPSYIRNKGIIRHDLDLDGYLVTSATRALSDMTLTLMVT